MHSLWKLNLFWKLFRVQFRNFIYGILHGKYENMYGSHNRNWFNQFNRTYKNGKMFSFARKLFVKHLRHRVRTTAQWTVVWKGFNIKIFRKAWLQLDRLPHCQRYFSWHGIAFFSLHTGNGSGTTHPLMHSKWSANYAPYKERVEHSAFTSIYMYSIMDCLMAGWLWCALLHRKRKQRKPMNWLKAGKCSRSTCTYKLWVNSEFTMCTVQNAHFVIDLCCWAAGYHFIIWNM